LTHPATGRTIGRPVARTPFDPDEMIVSHREPAAGDEPLTVHQVADLVRDALGRHVPLAIRVVGEVSNFADRRHWFFSLKDEQASLRCVMFASAVRGARHQEMRLEDGQQVVATGRLDFYDAQGQLQLYVEALEPAGLGSLELKFRRLCAQLRQKGYFDAQRKRPLPLVPRGVAVVTSAGGAALQDVINTARKRWAGCRLLLFDVRVQGAEAAPQIARALDALSRDGSRRDIDAVILTRGGGSIEDLWAFNEPSVAAAIYRSRVPVVAAIGHETDTTIAELVADLRCATPTQAAMQVVPDAAALRHQVDQVQRRMAATVGRQQELAMARLAAIERLVIFRRPQQALRPSLDRLDRLAAALNRAQLARVAAGRTHLGDVRVGLDRCAPRGAQRVAAHRLGALAARLTPAAARRISSDRQRLGAVARRLAALGPANVLRRGYSYTVGPDGRVVASVNRVRGGDLVTTHLHDGRFASRVEAVTGRGRKPAVRRGRTAAGKGGSQPRLFPD